MKRKTIQSAIVCALLLVSCASLPSQPATRVSTALSPTKIQPLPTQDEGINFTETPAPQPPPTLNAAESDAYISTLLHTNGDCKKPCFWGLIPGDTTIDIALNFLKSFGRTVLSGSRATNNYHTASVRNKDLIVIITLWEKDGILSSVDIKMAASNGGEISLDSLGAFALQEILEKYSQPTNVSFHLSYPTELPFSDDVEYGYILAYPEFIIEYTGQRTLATNPVSVCPLVDSGLLAVRLWFGENPVNHPVYGVDLETASSFATDDFVRLMLEEHDKACLNLQTEAFPP